ncbi:hypothetical protein HK102_007709 [Quaeritorhiza haematococci]|nr:hypothetical protein HK102_007709 [Quaeritorhiza haematococci]
MSNQTTAAVPIPTATTAAAPVVDTTSGSPSTSPKKGGAAKCSCGGCGDRAVKIIGDCRYCTKKFCSRHRLPEAHACPNMQSCRQDSINKNTNKLLGEKCVASKV